MGLMAALANFSKGEIAPALYGRIDTNQYAAGLKRARNFIVQKYGGVTFRPGTRLVGKVDDPTLPVRLAPFQFSIDQAYALVLGQGTMRPIARGGFVLEANTKITGATKAVQCALTVPFHGYSVGDRLYLTGIAGMVELNNRFATVVAVPDAATIVIDVNSLSFGTFVSSDGTLNAAPPPPPPPPPDVPPVVTPDPPPDVGGGGGNYCVAADSTMIRLANGARNGPGEERLARDVRVGDYVWTQHETTLAWDAYRVMATDLADDDVFVARDFPDATARHLFHVDGWRMAEELGAPGGRATVWKASVQNARTYLSRRVTSDRWVLSHNLKMEQQVDR